MIIVFLTSLKRVPLKKQYSTCNQNVFHSALSNTSIFCLTWMHRRQSVDQFFSLGYEYIEYFYIFFSFSNRKFEITTIEKNKRFLLFLPLQIQSHLDNDPAREQTGVISVVEVFEKWRHKSLNSFTFSKEGSMKNFTKNLLVTRCNPGWVRLESHILLESWIFHFFLSPVKSSDSHDPV